MTRYRIRMLLRNNHVVILLLLWAPVVYGFMSQSKHGSNRIELMPSRSRSRNQHEHLSQSRLLMSMNMNMNDEDDDDDDDLPDVDIRNFKPPPTFSRGGRSAPSQRKAMATKASSSTSVHVCTNCASEFVKWMGRCPTCREWNTLQEFKVDRKSVSSSSPRPSFGGAGTGTGTSARRSSSWLDGGDRIDSDRNSYNDNPPVRVTDVYKQVQKEQSGGSSTGHRPTRLQIPNDDELNTVMGGGIMTGSLTLLGGDPGVGKVSSNVSI